jgi:hypothetical protein
LSISLSILKNILYSYFNEFTGFIRAVAKALVLTVKKAKSNDNAVDTIKIHGLTSAR